MYFFMFAYDNLPDQADAHRQRKPFPVVAVAVDAGHVVHGEWVIRLHAVGVKYVCL